jgi:hypothetical protein
MHFIGRTYLKKKKDLKRAMPHLSVSMSKPFLEVAQNGIDKATSIKIVAEVFIKAKSLLWGMQG